MPAVNVKSVGIAALVFLMGCVTGGLIVQWHMRGSGTAAADIEGGKWPQSLTEPIASRVPASYSVMAGTHHA
jgi:hypothetical protein